MLSIGDMLSFKYQDARGKSFEYVAYVERIVEEKSSYNVYVPSINKYFFVPFSIAQPLIESAITIDDLYALAHLAVDTDDRLWFDEIMNRISKST